MARSQDYHLRMPKTAYDALQAIADREKRLLSDVVREALSEYTARKGFEVSFEVDRGGDRRKRGENESAE